MPTTVKMLNRAAPTVGSPSSVLPGKGAGGEVCREPRGSYSPQIRSTGLLPTTEDSPISEQTIWLIAIGLIVLDLALFMVPIVPFFVAYVLVVRPPWFKDFVDRLYDGG